MSHPLTVNHFAQLVDRLAFDLVGLAQLAPRVLPDLVGHEVKVQGKLFVVGLAALLEQLLWLGHGAAALDTVAATATGRGRRSGLDGYVLAAAAVGALSAGCRRFVATLALGLAVGDQPAAGAWRILALERLLLLRIRKKRGLVKIC